MGVAPDFKPDRGLDVPSVTGDGFVRNLIRTAVCEVRFPTLLQVDEVVPDFQRKIRRVFPHYERSADISVDPAGVTRSSAHIFRSKTRTDAISLRQSSLVYETSEYPGFAQFVKAVESTLDAAIPLLDTDFMTRLGLRYINVLDFNALGISFANLDTWVNPKLVGPVAAIELGAIDHAAHEVRGRFESGTFLLRYGLIQKPETRHLGFVLDLDFSVEGLPVDEAVATIRSMHRREFDLFVWCLGPAAIRWLESDKGST